MAERAELPSTWLGKSAEAALFRRRRRASFHCPGWGGGGGGGQSRAALEQENGRLLGVTITASAWSGEKRQHSWEAALVSSLLARREPLRFAPLCGGRGVRRAAGKGRLSIVDLEAPGEEPAQDGGRMVAAPLLVAAWAALLLFSWTGCSPNKISQPRLRLSYKGKPDRQASVACQEEWSKQATLPLLSLVFRHVATPQFFAPVFLTLARNVLAGEAEETAA